MNNMKKKLFSILALLCMAVTGAWAEEITIGDPTSTTTNAYLPSYSLYNYSLSQQIYTTDEIGTSGTINALTMWLKNSSSYSRNYNIYMKEVSQSSFADGNAWVSMAESNLVATATLSNGITDPVETTFTLTTPFEYSGTGNLVICFQDVTGQWSSGVASVVMTTSGHQAIYAYRDGSLYDPTSPGVTGSFATKDSEGVKSVVKFDISASGFVVNKPFELTKADGAEAHGTIIFKVNNVRTNPDDNGVVGVDVDDEVTVTITPDEGWSVGTVTGQWIAAVANAPRRAIDLLSDFTLSPVANTEDQWTFTMVRANAEISCTYRKLLTNGDITIADIEDVTYTTQPLTPEVTVKDGETVLTEGVDYTVVYSNNVEGGSQGVVTITGIGNYSGTATKNFNVVAAVYSTANAAIDVDVPEGLGQLTQETTGQTTDLYYFLQSYLQNSPNPAYIRLRLASMGQYVISQPLTVSSAITIEGDAETIATIDATQLGKNPFVRIDNNHTSGMLNEKGFCTNMYDVTFKNFQLKGLKGQVFYANKQKYLIPYFTVDNCIFRMEGASSKTFFDFNGGGFVEQFTLTNSTLSADDATVWSNGGFFSTESGSKLEDAGAQKFTQTLTNNTFYNVAKGQDLSTLRENSQPWMSFTIKDNVIVNSGKNGQFVKGLNVGLNDGTPSWLIRNNSFTFDGADVGASEISGASNIPIAANVEGEIVFANGDDGIAEGDFSLGACPQKEAKIGDPRWLNASLLSKLITPESLDDDKDLAKAINQGVQDGFVKFQLAENQRYTVKQSIVADKGLVIRGKNVTIDVEHADALVLMGKTPTGGFMPKSSTETAAPALNRAAGVEYTDYYKFDELTLSGLKVNGLKNSIIYDNNVKYCVTDLTIDNCVMQLETEAVKNDALIAFQAGGVNNLTVKNSTFYGNNGAKYFVRYNNSARIDRFGFDKADDTWSFTYENNTFYKTVKSDGQWGNYSGIVGKNAQGIVTVKNNIWYDCDPQTMRRMLGSKNFSQFSKASLMENNTFIVDGEAVDQGDYGNGSDLTGDPGFKKPAEGDFTLSAYSAQCNEKTGDPRWFAEGGHYNPVTGIETVETEKAEDGAWYTIQGVRVDKPAKGLYIHNGRKVVVK